MVSKLALRKFSGIAITDILVLWQGSLTLFLYLLIKFSIYTFTEHLCIPTGRKERARELKNTMRAIRWWITFFSTPPVCWLMTAMSTKKVMFLDSIHECVFVCISVCLHVRGWIFYTLCLFSKDYSLFKSVLGECNIWLYTKRLFGWNPRVFVVLDFDTYIFVMFLTFWGRIEKFWSSWILKKFSGFNSSWAPWTAPVTCCRLPQKIIVFTVVHL